MLGVPVADARVLMDPILDAFGVPATVTRPAPDATPVQTTAIWLAPLLEEQLPAGSDLQRREPRRVLAVMRSATLQSLKRQSLIRAPEVQDGPALLWRVDAILHVEYDQWRVAIVAA